VPADPSFANYCCELLAGTVGPCVPRRMFGGWGINTGGMTIALVADLGAGEKLWLKAHGTIRSHYEAAGSQRFTYMAKGVERSINYYSAPEEAMESAQLMAPWARQALDCALKAQSDKAVRSRPATVSRAKPARPAAKRPSAPTPSTTARRRSARG
jgi:DNA transformation protein and related proteins